MSPPEMRETTRRPILDSGAAPGLFVQPGAGQREQVTERTALLTKKIELVGEPVLEPIVRKEEHFRNIDKRTFWILYLTIIFGNIVAFFDSTLMASAHPVITSSFKSSNSASWLSTVFYLTSTVAQPLYGRVSDTVGRKPVFLFAQTMFLLSTLWCALAPDIGSFIAARAICGMGAGGVMSVSNMITSDVVKIEYRGIYQSYFNMAYGIGNGMGAAFGGLLCDSLGWRWAFGIQVPWIFTFLVVSYFVTPNNLGPNLAKAQGKSIWEAFETFDARGSVVVTVTVTSLILGINLGGNVLSWTHPFVIVCLILTIIGGCSIVPISRRATRPVLPLHLLAKSPNSNLMWASLFFSMCLNIVLFNVPLFLQAVRQTSPTVSGMYLILPLVGVALTAIFSGYFIAITRRMQPLLYCGQFLLVAGVIGTACLNQHLPTWAMLLLVPWVNIGQGFYFPTVTIATLSMNTIDDQAVVISTLGLFRSIGSILGVATSSWVLQNTLPGYLERTVKDADPAVKQKIIEAVRKSVQAIKVLDGKHKAQVVHAYALAMRVTFASGFLFAMMVLVLNWPIRLPKLRGQDEIESDTESEDEGDEVVDSDEGSAYNDYAIYDSDDDEGRGFVASLAALSRETTRTLVGRTSRRQSELRLSRETSRQALQLGRKASFDTTF